MKKWLKPIAALKPCPEAIDWAKKYKSLVDAWRNCERGDWMLWWLGHLSSPPNSDSHKRLVLAACACTRLALPYIPVGEKRPLTAIETAEQWARSEEGITLDDVRLAAHAAHTAADAAHAASYATADAAYATYATVRAQILAQCADIVRTYYPEVK